MTSVKANTTHGKASLLTIGTEVSSGEILNSNARWLSQQLSDMSIEVIRHLTVPDDAPLMTKSINQCAEDSELLILTGGLGPTTDDFTRDVVAQWVKRKLKFDEPSWQRIVDRLQAMNVPVAESNRQQCFFPEGCEIIVNHAGTANAFFLEHQQHLVLVLPGPPQEIRAIWPHAEALLRKALHFPSERTKLLYWHTMGISESQLGEDVELALKGSNYKTGYRPNIPYVDVKIWIPESCNTSTDPYLQAVEKSIGRYVVGRQNFDPAKDFIQEASKQSKTCILDLLTHGYLGMRLSEAMLDVKSNLEVRTFYGGLPESFNPHDYLLSLIPDPNNEGSWVAHFKSRVIELKYPRRITPENRERFYRYAAELSLISILRTEEL